MRGVAWIRAVIGMAAALYFGHWSAPAQADAPEQPTILLFSGTDLWRHGGSVHGGLLWSPEGLDREGFTLKLLSGAGVYRFHSGALATEIRARQFTAFALPGWRFIHENVQVTAFAGLDVQDHRLSPDDVSARLRGQLLGARSGFDFWYEPSPADMLAADASASTIGRSYSARLAYGWRFLESLYLGPEVHALGSDNYRQFPRRISRHGAAHWACRMGGFYRMGWRFRPSRQPLRAAQHSDTALGQSHRGRRHRASSSACTNLSASGVSTSISAALPLSGTSTTASG